MVAALLLAGGLAIASGASASKRTDEAKGMAGRRVASQYIGARAGEISKADAASVDDPVCDGDCENCQNEECVRNRSEEQQLRNQMESCEGECDGDCENCQNEECVRNRSEEQQLRNQMESCEGECDGDCLRTRDRKRSGS